jgi:hypothetical protein
MKEKYRILIQVFICVLVLANFLSNINRTRKEKVISAASDRAHKEVLVAQKELLEALKEAQTAQNLRAYLNCNRDKAVCDKLYSESAKKISDMQEKKDKNNLNKSQ